MSLYDIPVHTLSGQPASLRELSGKALLVVNVASKCGLTPQYEGLEQLHERYRDRGFSVVGFPCNQFGEQEPGTAEQIAEFCSVNYAVTFPMFEKIEVNGPGRHPIYADLAALPDAEGEAGDIQWNFEKFLVSPDGTVAARFRPMVTPEDPALIGAIEANLPAAGGSSGEQLAPNLVEPKDLPPGYRLEGPAEPGADAYVPGVLGGPGIAIISEDEDEPDNRWSEHRR